MKLKGLLKTVSNKNMYSPKIDEQYVPKLYKIADSLNVPMTSLVNAIVKDWLKLAEEKGVEELVTKEEE